MRMIVLAVALLSSGAANAQVSGPTYYDLCQRHGFEPRTAPFNQCVMALIDADRAYLQRESERVAVMQAKPQPVAPVQSQRQARPSPLAQALDIYAASLRRPPAAAPSASYTNCTTFGANTTCTTSRP